MDPAKESNWKFQRSLRPHEWTDFGPRRSHSRWLNVGLYVIAIALVVLIVWPR